MGHITRGDDPRHVEPCAWALELEALGLGDPDNLHKVAYKGCLHCGGKGYWAFTGHTRAGSFPDWEECRCVEENLNWHGNPMSFVGYHERNYGENYRALAENIGIGY